MDLSFKLYIGLNPLTVPNDVFMIQDTLKYHGFEGATIYHVDGYWQGHSEPSVVLELIQKDVTDEFTVTARVHTLANIIKFKLRQGNILLTRSVLESAVLI